MTSFLTKRDAWAGSFDELLLDEPRTDCPMHLPDAPEPAAPWGPIPTVEELLEGDEKTQEALERAVEERDRLLRARGPGHCSAWHGAKDEVECAGLDSANLKQRRNLRLLSQLVGAPAPNVNKLNVAEADVAMGRLWSEWMRQQREKTARAITEAETRQQNRK